MFNQYPYNPYQQLSNVIPYGQQNQREEVIKVNGEAGARAYNIAPNSSVLLLDETQPIIYLKVTDGGGYPTITAYQISPYQAEAPIDIKSLEERIARLEGMINNGESNT